MNTTTAAATNTTMQAIVSDPTFKQLKNIQLFKGPAAARDPDCTICILPFEDDEWLLKHEDCGQSFHADCLLQWLSEKCTCPWCRGCLKSHDHAELERELEEGEVIEEDQVTEQFVFGHLGDPMFDNFLARLGQDLNQISTGDGDANRNAIEAQMRQLLYTYYENEDYRSFIGDMEPWLTMVLDIVQTRDETELESLGLLREDMVGLAPMVSALRTVLAREDHILQEVNNGTDTVDALPEEEEEGNDNQIDIMSDTSDDQGNFGPPTSTHHQRSGFRRVNRLDIQSDHQFEILLRTCAPIDLNINNVEEWEHRWRDYWIAYADLDVANTSARPGYNAQIGYRINILEARREYHSAMERAERMLRDASTRIEHIRSATPILGPVSDQPDRLNGDAQRVAEMARTTYRASANFAAAAFRTRASEARRALETARSNAADGELWPEDPPDPLNY
ncbi:hypothetical protein OHC33_000653 [Knufia fluminis]|uniref:RING-type domain-containing protein n=1 Tax=Knufia fluminis TaxID=191047 RepID=A0AAN8EQR2_9EURO|nr:hypothetical protein OHC33_000653 [Knufia fluminis]